MKKNLTLIYNGSIVEATFLVELLKENNIGCILRDSLNESIIAGWASGMPESAVRIYVEDELADKANEIFETYFKSIK